MFGDPMEMFWLGCLTGNVLGFTRISFKVVKLPGFEKKRLKLCWGSRAEQDSTNQLITNLSHTANLSVLSDGQSANEHVFKTN